MLSSSARHFTRVPPRQCHQLFTYRLFHNVSLLDELEYRGLVQNVTRPEVLRQALQSKPQTVYSGVDPTASSLHIGHLLPFMTLLHFQIRGHRIISLIGAATGQVGDPSGRLTERSQANFKQVEDNAISIAKGIQLFFERASAYAWSRLEHSDFPTLFLQSPSILSNLMWHDKFTMLDFLHEVGKHVRINAMLSRESVRARLESQQGLSFTEFTYQLLQAYDFYHLYKHHSCNIQVGGSDQWGNMLAGLELIGRQGNPGSSSLETSTFGLTTPLLTTSTGEKFGKSAGNAVWLDPKLTSIFDFYQYFLKVTDDDVEKYLKLFTLLSRAAITAIIQNHQASPEKRIAQRRLASEVTELVHQRDGLVRAETLTQMFFGSNYEGLRAENVKSALDGDPRLVMLDLQEIQETPVTKLAAKYGLIASNSAAKNLVTSRGLYLNNQVVTEVQYTIPVSDLIDKRIAILRAGKGKLLVIVAN